MSISSGIRDEPRTFRLSVRVNANHGGPVSADVQDIDRLKTSGCRHVLILVHGFNNSAEEARQSYKTQTDLLLPDLRRSRIAPDAIAQFQWPGDEEIQFMPNWSGYAVDLERALVAAERLARFLADLGNPAAGATAMKVTLVGHSLGCRLILEALGRIPAANAAAFDVVSLMAAAVPVEIVARGQRLAPTGLVPRRLLKFFSAVDRVLQIAFPLGQEQAKQKGVEPKYYSEAVGRFGNPAEFGAAQSRPQNGHSDYWGDHIAANTLLETIDPTLRQPPPATPLGNRMLPAASEIGSRALPMRPTALGASADDPGPR